MDEKRLEKYMRMHRHDRVKMEMYHALTDMGYFQSCQTGSEKQGAYSESSAAKND